MGDMMNPMGGGGGGGHGRDWDRGERELDERHRGREAGGGGAEGAVMLRREMSPANMSVDDRAEDEEG